MMLRCLLLVLGFAPVLVGADWVVDGEESYVGFASVKNEVIAENHQFPRVSGRVSRDGLAEVQIELARVDTLIPIRDERLRVLLFEVDRYPLARVKAQLPLAELLAAGESSSLNVPLRISLHGDEVLQAAGVRVTRIGQGSFEVSSLGPILIHAAQFSLVAGVERLRAIAGLEAIDLMVPVTFSLRFVPAAEQD